MSKGVLSARGVTVDFSLLHIKEQIASVPKSVTVKAREDFIDQKFKRRLKRQTEDAIALVSAEVVEDVPTNVENAE